MYLRPGSRSAGVAEAAWQSALLGTHVNAVSSRFWLGISTPATRAARTSSLPRLREEASDTGAESTCDTAAGWAKATRVRPSAPTPVWRRPLTPRASQQAGATRAGAPHSARGPHAPARPRPPPVRQQSQSTGATPWRATASPPAPPRGRSPVWAWHPQVRDRVRAGEGPRFRLCCACHVTQEKWVPPQNHTPDTRR